MARIIDKKLIESMKGAECEVCGLPGIAHHVKSVGSGGDDVPQNLMPLCPEHHFEVHTIGLIALERIYGTITHWLDRNGWKKDEFLQKWVRLTEEGWED